jgi:[protein-PII] uridylyltransferase
MLEGMPRGDAGEAGRVAAVVAFAASMPTPYRDAFDQDAIAIHAGIVARRGERACWVEAWREADDRTLALCVVADDQPGLVTRISAALVAEALDVASAHAYTRMTEDGRVEAVDFFWVRRWDAHGNAVALRTPDVDDIGDTITALVTGRLPLDEAAPRPRIPTPPPPAASAGSVRVRFDRDEQQGSVVLTVQAPDRPGLLLALTQALFRADVQIVGLRAKSDGGSALDRFHLTERGGSVLTDERMRALQPLVFEAIASTLAG